MHNKQVTDKSYSAPNDNNAKKTIHTVGLVCIKNQKLLVVRSRNKETFYLPGGKIESGETAIAALIREIEEEIKITDLQDIERIFTIQDIAHGTNQKLVMECFQAKSNTAPKISAEIVEIKWVDINDINICAPAVIQVIKKVLKI